MIFCGIITGCYFCCCCFCFCCNFCCGKFKHIVEEEEGQYDDITKYEEASSEDEQSSGVVTEEPKSEKDTGSDYVPGVQAKTSEEKAAFAMPAPNGYDSIVKTDSTSSKEKSDSQEQGTGEKVKDTPSPTAENPLLESKK